jgi:putative flippase GtrA
MPELVERLVLWLNTKEGKKIFRYSMVSVISTGVSFTVLFLVYGVGHLWPEVPSTVFANVVATFPSYWLNRTWAWGKTGRSHLVKEIIPFWAMAAVGIAFSIVGASIAHHIVVKDFPNNHLAATAIVLAANLISFGIFWVAKLFLFNRLFHVPSLLEEIDEHVEHEAEVSDAGLR